MTNKNIEGLSFKWLSADQLQSVHLDECSTLFSNHYGTWSESAPYAGRRVRLTPSRLLSYLQGEEAWAALAYLENDLIGYAFAIRLEYNSLGTISWITQLVVHTDYRNQGIATRLLTSIWGFSDHFSWGIVSANPYAIRALEKATRRRCLPEYMMKYGGKLCDILAKTIPYLSKKTLRIDQATSIIDTQFPVDHSFVEEGIQNVTDEEHPWLLGNIDDGEEWFAATFRDQGQLTLSNEERNS